MFNNSRLGVLGATSGTLKNLPLSLLLFQMFTSTIFAVIGFLGAGYSFVISAISINRGPKCLMDNSTWGYPFHEG